MCSNCWQSLLTADAIDRIQLVVVFYCNVQLESELSNYTMNMGLFYLYAKLLNPHRLHFVWLPLDLIDAIN